MPAADLVECAHCGTTVRQDVSLEELECDACGADFDTTAEIGGFEEDG